MLTISRPRKQRGPGILNNVRHELGRGPEGQLGVDPPGLIQRVEGETGGERHDDDGNEVDAHRPQPRTFMQDHETADIRGRAGEQKTSAAPGLKPLSANAAAIGVDDAAQV